MALKVCFKKHKLGSLSFQGVYLCGVVFKMQFDVGSEPCDLGNVYCDDPRLGIESGSPDLKARIIPLDQKSRLLV